MVVAVVMAGGKGTRMQSSIEKPLINFQDQPLIQYVTQALNGVKSIDEILIATSPHTPHTKKWAEKYGFTIIETPGKGYVEDMGFLLSQNIINDKIILTVTADLPLITAEVIEEVLEYYSEVGKPALSVLVPVEIFQKYGLQPSMVWEDLVPSGLNILRGKNTQQDEELLIIDKIEVALNINSPEDIISLRKLGVNSRR